MIGIFQTEKTISKEAVVMLKIKKIGSEISTNIKWFISYLFVIIVPITMCILLWYHMQTSINDERIRFGKLQIKNIVKSVEAEAKFNAIAANQFKNSQIVKQAMSLVDINTSYDKEILERLSSEIINYKSKFGIRDSVFIYLKRVDIIVNEDGCFTPYNFWKKNYYNSNIGFAAWKNMIGKSMDVPYNLYTISFSDKGGYNYQSFLHTSILDRVNGNNYAVMAVQNYEPVDYLKEIDDSYFIIYDEHGELVYGPGNIRQELFPILSRSTTDEVVKSSNSMYIISHATSQSLKYKFVVAVKLYDVFTTSPVPFIYMGIIILMSAFCIWLLWVISQKNYTVIDKIVMRLKAVRGEGTSANEVSMIDSLIDKLIQEYQDTESLLRQQHSQFVSINISRLLHGHIKVFEEIQSGLVENNQIEFLSDYFAVIVIVLEDYKKFLGGTNQIPSEIGLVKFAVKNVAEEVIAAKGNRGYFAETEEIPAILVSLSPENLPNAKEMLIENCRFIQNFLSQQLNIRTTISISNIGMGVFDINRIYRQAIEFAEYKYVLGEEIVITPEDIDIQRDIKYTFTQERENWLINFLKLGEKARAIDLIDSVLYLEPKENMQDIKRLQCITYDVAAALIRFCCEEELSKEVFNEGEFLESLMNAKNIESMYTLISDAVEQICSQYTPENNLFVNNVTSYIDKVYSDNSISVTSISEHFGLHPTYMSNLFKEKTGIGLLEYINKVRINKSIEIMMNTNLTINEISEKVGYLNANTYIRVFKKLMGVTPNKYRTIKKTNF